MTKKKKPDNVADNPSILPYGSNVGAPAIKSTNIDTWKNEKVIKTNKYFKARYNEIKEEEKYYFNLLKQVGILYDSPEQAALKLNQIYNDPNEWWFSSSVQNARKIFINRFALTDKNWLNIWADELLNIAKK